MVIRINRQMLLGLALPLSSVVVCQGCGAKQPQAIQASPEQQQKWIDEENAGREKKLQEARASGQLK